MEPHGAPPWWIFLWPLVVAAVLVGLLQGCEWWLNRRAQRDWDHGEAERQRRWAEEDRRQALQQQRRELEQQILEEQLSDEERAWRRQYRKREADNRREARRRLGLPEEEA